MSNIEWTDATWNCLVGCTPVSPGCLNCYAATMAHRLEAMGAKGYERSEHGLRIAEVRNDRAVFTGSVRLLEDRLSVPLRWRKPRRIFVNSMSDLFHEAVPFDFIDRVFAVMALCPQHTFQVLTKRPERMAEYTSDYKIAARLWDYLVEHNEELVRLTSGPINTRNIDYQAVVWPLPNVWLGTSVENQAMADERIPHLLRCPAAVRFLSCEPLLGEVDLREHLTIPLYHCDQCGNEKRTDFCSECDTEGNAVSNAVRQIHWVIGGGESGPKARPTDVAWLRSLRDQCKRAGVPYLVKQLGSHVMVRNDQFDAWPDPDAISDSVDARYTPAYQGEPCRVHLRDRKGGDPSEWPEVLRVREWPKAAKEENP